MRISNWCVTKYNTIPNSIAFFVISLSSRAPFSFITRNANTQIMKNKIRYTNTVSVCMHVHKKRTIKPWFCLAVSYHFKMWIVFTQTLHMHTNNILSENNGFRKAAQQRRTENNSKGIRKTRSRLKSRKEWVKQLLVCCIACMLTLRAWIIWHRIRFWIVFFSVILWYSHIVISVRCPINLSSIWAICACGHFVFASGEPNFSLNFSQAMCRRLKIEWIHRPCVYVCMMFVTIAEKNPIFHDWKQKELFVLFYWHSILFQYIIYIHIQNNLKMLVGYP